MNVEIVVTWAITTTILLVVGTALVHFKALRLWPSPVQILALCPQIIFPSTV